MLALHQERGLATEVANHELRHLPAAELLDSEGPVVDRIGGEPIRGGGPAAEPGESKPVAAEGAQADSAHAAGDKPAMERLTVTSIKQVFTTCK